MILLEGSTHSPFFLAIFLQSVCIVRLPVGSFGIVCLFVCFSLFKINMLLLIWNVSLHCVGLLFLLPSCIIISSPILLLMCWMLLRQQHLSLVLCLAGMPSAC